MSVNACWSRPIAVLDGNERQAVRTFSARKSRLPAHSRGSPKCISRNARMLLISLLKTYCVFAAPLTFPLMGVKFRQTLRVRREFSLLRECTLFPAPPVGWACSSFQCLTQPFVCCTSADSPFWSARSYGRFTRPDSVWQCAPTPSRFRREKRPSTNFLRPRTCGLLSSSLPSPSC